MNIPPTLQRSDKQLKHPWLILALIALVALITEEIFFEHPDGMQWAIFVLLILLAILASVLIERLKVPSRSLWLILPILVLSALHLFRSETFSQVSLVLATLVCLMSLGTSFLNGQWASYRLREHTNQTFMLFLNTVIGLPGMLIDKLRHGSGNKSASQAGAEIPKPIWAVLRGLLIALPILAIFSVLFASADAVFSNRVTSLFDWLGNFNLGRFLQETFLVAVITYITFGLFSFALTKTDKQQTLVPDKPLVKPFLGVTEANVVLGLVNLLFVLFLAIQFRYFFAGQVNISESGMT
jgi:hypothetical protein